jgi:hypothetical protein
VRVRGHGQPSGLSGSLRIVPGEDPTEGSVLDPDGREVVLLVRIWAEKITRDHPDSPVTSMPCSQQFSGQITSGPTRCRTESAFIVATSAPAGGCSRS